MTAASPPLPLIGYTCRIESYMDPVGNLTPWYDGRLSTHVILGMSSSKSSPAIQPSAHNIHHLYQVLSPHLACILV